MDAATIRIAVEADGSGVARGMAVASAAVGRFESVVGQSLGRVSAAFNRLSTATKVLGGLGLGIGVLAVGFAAVIGPAIQFESAFAGVLKTVDGTPAQLDAIRTGLLDLSRVMPTSASDLAAIAENAGQLGVAAPDVLEFTKVIAQLGETTDLDFESAAQSLARFLNITGNDASITNLADVIVDLGNNSATTESQILTFASRLGSAFTVAGASEDQILALGAAFSSLGVEAEAGASSLNRVITQIADAAKLGGQDLNTFAETAGVLPEEFANIAAANPVDALLLFGQGLRDLTEDGRSITPVLKDLELDGIRTSRVLQLLALGADDIQDSLNLAAEAFEGNGAAQEEYNRRAETTASRLEVLQNRLQALAIELGTPALDTFARGADLAGDAVEGLVDILRPLGAELGSTFSNLATTAGLFFDVIGGPALQVAAAGIVGLSTALTGVLTAFNALGPAGTILAGLIATLALFPGVITAARAAALAFSIQLGGIAAASTATTVSIAGMQVSIAGLSTVTATASAAVAGFKAVLVSTGPYLAVAAALVVLGEAYVSAGRDAEESATRFREAFDSSLDTRDFERTELTISRVRDRILELEQAAGTTSDSFLGRLGTSIRGVGEILTPFNNTVIDAQRELEALNEVYAGDEGLVRYREGIQRISEELGISVDRASFAANELGLVADVAANGGEEFANARAAIDEYTGSLDGVADKSQVLVDKVLAGTASQIEFADVLGLTVNELGFLADQIEGVSLDDLLDAEKAGAAFDAIDALNNAYGELATQIGLTGTELINGAAAVDNMAAAHNNLRSAVSDASNALATMAEQQRITEEATDAFAEALNSVSDVESLELAASAMRTLSLEYAASGVSAGQAAAKQQELYREFLAAGEAAGFEEEAVIAVATALGLVPEEVLALLTVEGQAAAAAVEEQQRRLDELAGEYGATLTAEDRASEVLDALNQQVDLFPGTYLADMLADGSQPRREIPELLGIIDGWPGTYTANLEAATAVAREAVDGAVQKLGEWVGIFPATLTADDQSEETVDDAIGRAVFWATTYGAGLEAEDRSEPVVTSAQERLIAYSLAEYRAQIEADGTPAETTIETVLGSLGRVNDTTATPTVDANPAPFSTKIAETEGDLVRVDGTTAIPGVDADLARFKAGIGEVLQGVTLLNRTVATPTITANTGVARARLTEIINLIRNIRSKGITITTTYVSKQSNANGSVSPQGPTQPTYDPYRSGAVLADGGVLGVASLPPIVDPPVGIDMSRAITERPGRAQIYQPTTPGRFFAEPETGGEAYIPLAAGKRDQSIRIWEITGKLLGVMADGGIQTAQARRYMDGGLDNLNRAAVSNVLTSGVPRQAATVAITAPIQIDIQAERGMDLEEIDRRVRVGVAEGLSDAGRRYNNTRR